jgi:hypothetical protein
MKIKTRKSETAMGIYSEDILRTVKGKFPARLLIATEESNGIDLTQD